MLKTHLQNTATFIIYQETSTNKLHESYVLPQTSRSKASAIVKWSPHSPYKQHPLGQRHVTLNAATSEQTNQ